MKQGATNGFCHGVGVMVFSGHRDGITMVPLMDLGAAGNPFSIAVLDELFKLGGLNSQLT